MILKKLNGIKIGGFFGLILYIIYFGDPNSLLLIHKQHLKFNVQCLIFSII